MSEKFRRFTEYLDNKGRVGKPKTDATADTGPSPSKAPPAPVNKSKGWSNKNALSEKPKPYHPPQTPEKQPKYEKGFAQEGDKKLVYEPETPEEIGKEGGKKVATWPKTTATTTEEFLAVTKDMSVAELVAYMKAQHQTEAQVETHPVILIDRVAEMVSKNDKLMESLLYALKRNGVVLEVTDAPASETEITKKYVKPASKTMPPSEDVKRPDGKPATPKRTASIGGEKLDMADSGVVTTKARF